MKRGLTLMYAIVSPRPITRAYYSGDGRSGCAPGVSMDRRDAMLYCSPQAAEDALGRLSGLPPGRWRVESVVMSVTEVDGGGE